MIDLAPAGAPTAPGAEIGTHAVLRAATAAAHDAVDAAFARFDLHDRAGLGRFLAAHHAALAPLMPAWVRWCTGELELPAPNWTGLIAADLADLGLPVPAPVPLDGPIMDGAVGYVVTGSRLGLAMIRKGGWWGEADGLAGRYLGEGSGPALWRAAREWLARQNGARAELLAAEATRAFSLFAAAAGREG